MQKLVLGNHYLIDYYECNSDILSIVKKIKEIMLEAGKKGNLHIVGEYFHQFKPYGVSGVLILKESHFTIHTWPEYNYASVDLYLCDRTVNVMKITEYLFVELKAKNYKIDEIQRGL